MSTTDRPGLIELTPAAARGELRVFGPQPTLNPVERAALEHRAKLLAWVGNAWHVVEFAIAVAAGIAAGSVALVGFGLDSLIELLAGGVIVWLFSRGPPYLPPGRTPSAAADCRELRGPRRVHHSRSDPPSCSAQTIPG